MIKRSVVVIKKSDEHIGERQSKEHISMEEGHSEDC